MSDTRSRPGRRDEFRVVLSGWGSRDIARAFARQLVAAPKFAASGLIVTVEPDTRNAGDRGIERVEAPR